MLTNNFLPEACAAVFGLILCICLRVKYADATEANTYFRQMAIAVTAAAVTDVFSTAVRNAVAAPPAVYLFNTTLFYVATVTASYYLLRYITMCAGRQEGRYFQAQKYILIADLVILTVNLFTGRFFRYDAEGAIVYGPLHLPVTYGVAVWFLMSACVVQGIHSGKYTMPQRIILRFAGASMLIAFIIQFFFLRHLMFSFAVGIFYVYLVFFGVEMPVYLEIIGATQRLTEKQKEAGEAALKAQRASRAKNRFLANTSQEIRTPVEHILACSEKINESTREEKVHQMTAEIRNAGESLRSIIDDVLEYADIEEKRIKADMREFSVTELMTQMAGQWEERIVSRGLSFQREISPQVPERIIGDIEKTKRILDCLLDNACKYTEQGSISLLVSCETREGELFFYVEDSGQGIRSEDLAHVFHPFTRAALEENRDKKGTGLGLRIADEYARMLGGHLEAESTFGQGSLFTLCLPIAPSAGKGTEAAE